MKTLLVIGMILALFVGCAHSPDYVPTHEGTMATADLEANMEPDKAEKALGDLTPEERKADMEKIDKFVEGVGTVIGIMAFIGLIVFCVANGALIFF
ncbi:MAG: hypothetical protein ACFFCW_41110 [Candidatus Hodarchaeota archaeon]